MFLSLCDKVLENTTMVLYTCFVMKMLSYWQKSRHKHGRGEHIHVCMRRSVHKPVHVHVAGEINRLLSPENHLMKNKHRLWRDISSSCVVKPVQAVICAVQ